MFYLTAVFNVVPVISLPLMSVAMLAMLIDFIFTPIYMLIFDSGNALFQQNSNFVTTLVRNIVATIFLYIAFVLNQGLGIVPFSGFIFELITPDLVSINLDWDIIAAQSFAVYLIQFFVVIILFGIGYYLFAILETPLWWGWISLQIVKC